MRHDRTTIAFYHSSGRSCGTRQIPLPCGAQGQSKGACDMKMTSALVERTLTQIDAKALPDNHPAIPQLIGMFGEHTFFLDENGLNIVEPLESSQAEAKAAKLVNVASWDNSDPPNLTPHD